MKDFEVPKEVPEVTLKKRSDNISELNVKSTNYLMRTFMATDSRNKGGYIGIE